MIDFQAARTAMVDGQVRPSDVTSYPILESMLSIPREAFVPESKRSIAYAGDHIDLGAGRVVMDPRVLAKMLEVVDIQADDLVLHIGAGYGYSTAVIARMAEVVIAVEEVEAMASEAQTRLVEQSADNAIVHTGALVDGAAAHGPYDVILIEGGVETVPEALLQQLKLGGRIVVISMHGVDGECRLGRQTAQGVQWRDAFDATAPVLAGFAAEKKFTF